MCFWSVFFFGRFRFEMCFFFGVAKYDILICISFFFNAKKKSINNKQIKSWECMCNLCVTMDVSFFCMWHCFASSVLCYVCVFCIAFRRVDALVKVIKREDIHDRLFFGSDYPVPCTNIVVWNWRLVNHELLTKKQANTLKEIYTFNPLLADFVKKRAMRFIDKQTQREYKFKDCIFQAMDVLYP